MSHDTSALQAVNAPVLLVVIAPVADMHKESSSDSDVVSQAVFGSHTVLVGTAPGWAKVRTSDDYEGWIEEGELRPTDTPYAHEGRTAIVESLFAAVYREPDIEKHEPIITLPFEAKLEVTGEEETPDALFYSVRLPDGRSGWVQSGDVTLSAQPLSIPQTIELAKRFMGLPYRWGGTSSLGFDCSGYTQMLMRHRGVIMPRDTRPQASWNGLAPVDRSALKAGDLLFFGKTPDRINHTGMYIGKGQFIHASRYGKPAVQINKLDDEPWTTQFITARRAG